MLNILNYIDNWNTAFSVATIIHVPGVQFFMAFFVTYLLCGAGRLTPLCQNHPRHVCRCTFVVEYLPMARKWTRSWNRHNGQRLLYDAVNIVTCISWFRGHILNCRTFTRYFYFVYSLYLLQFRATLVWSAWFVAVLDLHLTVPLWKLSGMVRWLIYRCTNLNVISYWCIFLAVST